jgi:hypothetical protein
MGPPLSSPPLDDNDDDDATSPSANIVTFLRWQRWLRQLVITWVGWNN